MIELPEATVLANQVRQELTGKTVSRVIAGHSPHKFAWYHGDPSEYDQLLRDKTIAQVIANGGMVEIQLNDANLLFADGVSLRLTRPDAARPAKHQLLVEFTDGHALSASVQMYGGLWAFRPGEYTNPYYLIAREKPSPLDEQFTTAHFASLLDDKNRKKSAKAFLATEQRIPGLGNGVLQDILWNAHIHPRRPVDSLSEQEIDDMFLSIKATLRKMSEQGGRDTEKNLFGQPGGYLTRLCKNTVNYACPTCVALIKKETYLGGSIYYCPGCQRL